MWRWKKTVERAQITFSSVSPSLSVNKCFEPFWNASKHFLILFILISGSLQAGSLHCEGRRSWTWSCDHILPFAVSTYCRSLGREVNIVMILWSFIIIIMITRAKFEAWLHYHHHNHQHQQHHHLLDGHYDHHQDRMDGVRSMHGAKSNVL